MPVVHRAFGYRFVIYVNDHAPPHVHVVGHGGEAKIVLETQGGLAIQGISVDWSVGISAGDMQQLLHEATHARPRLLSEWYRIHG